MAIRYDCFDCGRPIIGDDLDRFGAAFIAHVRSAHPDWPYSDTAVRNFAEATQRLDGPSTRLDAIGPISVHPVDAERLDDWLDLFDRRGFVDNPAWAACYCAEPHLQRPDAPPGEVDTRSWRQNRDLMIDRLSAGTAHGYLAYVDGVAAGWVNASRRSDYALYCCGAGADPPDHDVIGVSCFLIAPPYRRHGLAAALLDRVIADAPTRGARWIEGYPYKAPEGDAGQFRGPRSLYEARGFRPAADLERYVVMRRAAR